MARNRITHAHHGQEHIYELAATGGLIFIDRRVLPGDSRKSETWHVAVGPPAYLEAIEAALRAMA